LDCCSPRMRSLPRRQTRSLSPPSATSHDRD
jgi:hypothetical protein